MTAFFQTDTTGLMVTLKVQPKASRAGIEGAVATPDGWALKVAVTAAPDKGQANAAVVELLAKAFGLAKRDVDLMVGAASRRKRVHLAGEPNRLAAIAQQWMPV